MTTTAIARGKVLFFSGPETFLLHEQVKAYFAAAKSKYGEYNVEKIDPFEHDLDTIKSHLFSLPFFATGKRILFFDPFPWEANAKITAENKEKAKKILDLLAEIPEEIVVICISENPDRRTKVWKDLQKIADSESSREFHELSAEKLTQWIIKRVAEQGGKILPAAAEYLWQYTGSNLWALAHEIDKLVKFTGDKPISERDIDTACEPGIETVQFALSNAFAKGSEAEVMSVLERLIASGESAYSLLYRDLGSIIRQFLLVRSALDQRKGAKDIGLNPFIFGRMKTAVARFSFEHLRAMQEKLVQIDVGAKTGLIPVISGKEDLLFFALEKWVREFFQKKSSAG